jgi:hypothetical protein
MPKGLSAAFAELVLPLLSTAVHQQSIEMHSMTVPSSKM